MGLLWNVVKVVALIFGAIVALLLVIDGALFANLFRKKGGT
ncbi:MAG: hypothetical protein NVS3B7_05820 [Candidatus Elarobacter sp.]